MSLREPYTEKSYTYWSKYIGNVLVLRPPQKESLERFARICDILSLSKTPNLDNELKAICEYFPTLTSFEREFPSICFALATGIGKTRLMGAFIAYLVYEKNIHNFFVMAPNLTIYKKLKVDLGEPSSSKYVFSGLDKFVTPPRIIDGDNYEEFRQMKMFDTNIIINIFNISKLNADSKTTDGKPARIKRLNEVLGQSYFEYLQSLPDLCVLMDESHHYHADRSFDVINELKPILGVELTATPQIQRGSKKIDFKNVVYEYSLAHALNDGLYVKVPAIFTRKDFRPAEYTQEQLDREKLNDGIKVHQETKSRLDVYARNLDKAIVKPFVLVVAKDTEHSKQIQEYLTSEAFFKGYYKGKVLEINSAQRGSEKDENIELLLSLEQIENKIEIVIHVNMLKEGWDVTNLYTIIPLRASASETLTEQTIGRGLRLPYGQRTGEDEIDRLSIVSHDRYADIINLAKHPNSLVRRVYYIDPAAQNDEQPRETVEMPSMYHAATSAESFTQQLVSTMEKTVSASCAQNMTPEQMQNVPQFIGKETAKTVIDLNKHVRTFNAVKDEEIRKIIVNDVITKTLRQFPNLPIKREDIASTVAQAIDTCVQALTSHVIPIPVTVVRPYPKVQHGFYNFTLDMRNINWHPSGDTLLGAELQEDGKTFEYNLGVSDLPKIDTVENEITRHIIAYDNVDYRVCSELIYSLIEDAKSHFKTYLTDEESEKVMRDRQRSLAEVIYTQMNQHFYKEEVEYRATEMRPFTKIETSFAGKFVSDDLYDLRANLPASEVKKKIFKGFTKACHTLYRFDSDTERKFAIVLENDKNEVQKWLRPSPKQFDIYYGAGGIKRYEPDFIVETEHSIYMVETKALDEVNDALLHKSGDVWEKALAAKEYCHAVSQWNKNNDGKPWQYALIAHTEITLQSSFKHLMDNRARIE